MFDCSKIQPGMPVRGLDDEKLGNVREVGADSMIVEKRGLLRSRHLEIKFADVREMRHGYLYVAHADEGRALSGDEMATSQVARDTLHVRRSEDGSGGRYVEHEIGVSSDGEIESRTNSRAMDVRWHEERSRATPEDEAAATQRSADSDEEGVREKKSGVNTAGFEPQVGRIDPFEHP